MNKEKLLAILTAAQLYLEQEEAARAPTASAPAQPAAEPGPWAQAGRQDLMSGRRMIQLRAFASAR